MIPCMKFIWRCSVFAACCFLLRLFMYLQYFCFIVCAAGMDWRSYGRLARRSSKEEKAMALAAPLSLEYFICDEADAMRIHELLHRMEESYKEVFMLRIFGELPFKKIAHIFEKTESRARVTYHRARLKLISEMEESNEREHGQDHMRSGE